MDAKHRRTTDVAILDCTSCRLVQAGQETFRQILLHGGSVRVLLFRPDVLYPATGIESPCDRRIRAELLLALTCWEEVSRAVDDDAASRLELRWCRETRASGLLLINGSREGRVVMTLPLPPNAGAYLDLESNKKSLAFSETLAEAERQTTAPAAVQRFEERWTDAEKIEAREASQEWCGLFQKL